MWNLEANGKCLSITQENIRVGNKITADRTTTVAGFSERSNVLHDVKKLSTDKTFSETARQEWQSIIRT